MSATIKGPSNEAWMEAGYLQGKTRGATAHVLDERYLAGVRAGLEAAAKVAEVGVPRIVRGAIAASIRAIDPASLAPTQPDPGEVG